MNRKRAVKLFTMSFKTFIVCCNKHVILLLLYLMHCAESNLLTKRVLNHSTIFSTKLQISIHYLWCMAVWASLSQILSLNQKFSLTS